MKVLDFGCGAGHFVKACEVMNVVAEGVDPNYELIKTGRKFINKNNILNLNFEESFLKMLNTNADVISLIFVLEHLENPERVFRTFAASNAQYLYISVPLFSLTSLIQSSFDRIYPRQLGGPHTHLYTKESLEYIAKKNNLKIIGEWWFGTDFLDFYRSLVISQKYTSKAYIKQLDSFFLNQIDNLQNILDKNKICSEVHLIFKKNKSL